MMLRIALLQAALLVVFAAASAFAERPRQPRYLKGLPKGGDTQKVTDESSSLSPATKEAKPADKKASVTIEATAAPTSLPSTLRPSVAPSTPMLPTGKPTGEPTIGAEDVANDDATDAPSVLSRIEKPVIGKTQFPTDANMPAYTKPTKKRQSVQTGVALSAAPSMPMLPTINPTSEPTMKVDDATNDDATESPSVLQIEMPVIKGTPLPTETDMPISTKPAKTQQPVQTGLTSSTAPSSPMLSTGSPTAEPTMGAEDVANDDATDAPSVYLEIEKPVSAKTQPPTDSATYSKPPKTQQPSFSEAPTKASPTMMPSNVKWTPVPASAAVNDTVAPLETEAPLDSTAPTPMFGETSISVDNSTEATFDTIAPSDTLSPTPLFGETSSQVPFNISQAMNDTVPPMDTEPPLDSQAPTEIYGSSQNDTAAPLDTEMPVDSLIPTLTPYPTAIVRMEVISAEPSPLETSLPTEMSHKPTEMPTAALPSHIPTDGPTAEVQESAEESPAAGEGETFDAASSESSSALICDITLSLATIVISLGLLQIA